MRLITKKKVLLWINDFPKAKTWLTIWATTVKLENWNNLSHLQESYPKAEMVRADSGSKLTVFNASGNDYRLIARVNYLAQKVYTFEFLTHSAYDKGKWKKKY